MDATSETTNLEQVEHKIFYQCQWCCRTTDSRTELLAHIAVHHLKNYLQIEIKNRINQFPFCPHPNCGHSTTNISNIVEHYKVMHYPKVLDIDGINETLSRKCSKCFVGPYDSQANLLKHIAIKHGKVVEAQVRKHKFASTLEPLRKVI